MVVWLWRYGLGYDNFWFYSRVVGGVWENRGFRRIVWRFGYIKKVFGCWILRMNDIGGFDFF